MYVWLISFPYLGNIYAYKCKSSYDLLFMINQVTFCQYVRRPCLTLRKSPRFLGKIPERAFA